MTLRSDCGGEYMAKEFGSLLKKNGINHQLKVRSTPQQNEETKRNK